MPSRLPLTILLITITTTMLPTNLAAQGITIANGGHVVVNDAASITINNGGFNNAGTFHAGTGTVAFTGTTSAIISGTDTTSFYNLTISKTNSLLQLSHTVGVSNILSMSGGNIDLNGVDLTLGTTGTITGEGPTSRILGPAGGYLIRSAILNAPTGVTPGNIGLTITTTSNPGLTTIKRGHQALQLTGGFGIDRFFDVDAANGTDSNTTLRFSYLDQELGSIVESELGVYSISTTNPGGLLQTQNAFDPVANYIQVPNTTLSGRYVLASSISDPARSTNLTAVLVDDKANLAWTTAYEINTDYYELERAADGHTFQRFTTIAAAGTGNAEHNYTYTDPDPIKAPMYYRYKLTFKDGSIRYSNIASVAPQGYNNLILQVYPNPVTGPVNVRFSSNKTQKVKMQIIDNLGVVIVEKESTAVPGLNIISYDLSQLAPGVYYLRMLNIRNTPYKIIKEQQ